jgi:hypothetical protein
MRNSGLLVVLLCGSVSVCRASDSALQSASQQAAGNSLRSDWLDASGIVRPDYSGMAASFSDQDRRRFDSARDGDLTCYTIHSYLVKRQSPDSDVTEPVGHSTCQRASKYNVKKVEGPDKPPSR